MRVEKVVVALLGVALALVLAQAGLSQGDGGHPAGACSEAFHVSGAGWDACWQQEDARVQGLEMNRVFFQGESVAWKMGVPFSLTEYESALGPGPFKDVLGDPPTLVPGYGNGSMTIDAGDCPRFHSVGELVNDDRVCVEHEEGGPLDRMSLWSKYDLFNYRFLQGWHFDDRGVIEPFVYLGGHLLDGTHVGDEGIDHQHHPYWRVDFDIGNTTEDTFQLFQRLPGKSTGGTPGGNVAGITNVPSQRCTGGEVTPCSRWVDIAHETQMTYNQETYDKWRVVDRNDVNAVNRSKSYEFVVKSDGPSTTVSSFDAMVVEYSGDSSQIGHGVPQSSQLGDTWLKTFMAPPEEITDPVVWIVNHAYHDTRDEDRGSMVYHDVGFTMQPRNFVDENPSEATFP